MSKLLKVTASVTLVTCFLLWSVLAYGADGSGSGIIGGAKNVLNSFAESVAQTNPGDASDSADAGGSSSASDDMATTPAEVTSKTTPTGSPDDAVEETRPGTFEISFQDTDLVSALRMLGRQGKKNIVTGKDITGSVSATLYDVTFYEALDAILRMNGYVYLEDGNFIYIYTPAELAAATQAAKKLKTRMFKLSYVTAQDAEVLIGPSLSSSGTIATTPAAQVGVPDDTTSAGGNDLAIEDILVVRDYEENLEEVAAILAELDVRPDQVLIEATILSARIDEDNAMGVNFSTLANLDFQTIGSESTGVGNMSQGGLSGDSLKGVRAAEISTGFDTIDGGLTIGFLSNSTAFFITALEEITDITILANPKLLVLNKQRGQVVVGARDGYKTTVVNDGVSTEEVEFLETGTRLFVRPYVGADGFIRMEIHPEDSDGSVDSSGLPSEVTTEVTSNVLVKDGQTVVIGGLFRDEVSQTRSQVPMFGDLKGAGALFRNNSDKIERHEVIIVITPHIIRYNADHEVDKKAADDINRFYIGARKGMQWWGRQPLATHYTRTAHEALQRGDEKSALWNVDLALSLNPSLYEAIELKEQLTHRTYFSDAVRVSGARSIVEDMIQADIGESLDDEPTEFPVDVKDNVEIVPITPEDDSESMSPLGNVETEAPRVVRPRPDFGPAEDEKMAADVDGQELAQATGGPNID
jgi:type IV pilus assembly protein PilQ